MPPVSKTIRMLVLVVSGLVLLSALGLGGAAAGIQYVVAGQKPSWLLFGFEVVVGAAGVLGVLFGRGKFGEGPGLALACIGGTVLAGSALGWLAAGKQVGGHSITPLLGPRVLAAGVIGLAGAYCVLSRNPKSWKVAAWGAGTGAPVVIAAMAMMRGSSRRVIESAVSSGVLGTVGAVVGLVVVAACLCASVHLVVKAFEMGRVGEG